MRKSLEDASAEDVDHALCKLNKLTEAWKDRFTCSNPRFAERYVKGELELAVFFNVFDRAGHRKELGAIFNGLPAAFCDQGQSRHLNWSGLEPFGGYVGKNIRLVKDGPYRNDLIVFIHDVEFAENPKGFAPTLVRLQSPDKLLSLLAGTLYGTLEVAGEPLLACTDRKAGPSPDLPAVCYNTLAYEMIEGGSQIVDDISDDQRNLNWDSFVGFEPKDVISSFRVILSDHGIWLSRAIRPEFRIEIRKMMFGPLDLQFDAVQRI